MPEGGTHDSAVGAGTSPPPPLTEPRQLIALVGGESTGKSTLAGALTRELPAVAVPETLRAWVEHHGRAPRAEEQRDVMRAHLLAEAAAMADPAPPAWVVSDSGPIMTAVYSILYFDDYSLAPEAIELSSGLAVVVWCAADIPWVPDGDQRDGPHRRAEAQEVIGELLDGAGLPVLRVHGSVGQRVAQVRAYLGV